VIEGVSIQDFWHCNTKCIVMNPMAYLLHIFKVLKIHANTANHRQKSLSHKAKSVP
jgi:hypothetical protein